MRSSLQQKDALPREGAIACDNCPVREISACSVLPRHERASLSRVAHAVHFEKGATLTVEGDVQDYVASITSGIVKMIKLLPDGRQQIVGLAFPADLVGRPFAKVARCTLEAATDITMCSFDRQTFETKLRENPDVERFVLSAKLDELDQARDWMLLLGRKTASEKLATFLHMLADRHARSHGEPTTPQIKLPLTRTEIADYLGLTIETVSRQLTKLRAEGVIELSGGRGVVVKDTERLRALAG